jgi:hypothetical protein
MARIDTTVIDKATGTTTTLEQHVTVERDELVYNVEDGKHEVRVNADAYISMLVELTGWKPPRTARDRIGYMGDDE